MPVPSPAWDLAGPLLQAQHCQVPRERPEEGQTGQMFLAAPSGVEGAETGFYFESTTNQLARHLR